MKILYGVVGEGMGHAMRSRVVLSHLVEEGHEVVVMASSRAADYLAKRFSDVRRIHGLHIVYDENRVRRSWTVWSNILQGTAALPSQIAAYFNLIADFRPVAVVSDFESWTYFYAKAHGLPCYSVDNMQIINRCRHPDELLEGARTNFELTRAFIKAKLPFCDHYFITTYFRPEIRKERTSLHPPILRPEILAAKPTRGEHLLVYQTAEGHEALAGILARSGRECRIYGMRRDIMEEEVEGNLRYRPFDEAGFIADLASARAVIAGGGFTLLGEAVFLHKPVLSVPVRGQFEQVLNGRYLERDGYGMTAPEIDEAVLGRFLERLDACEERLAGVTQDGNKDLFAALDSHLDRAAAGVA
ncbi:MAG: teichoic acid biosynthesis protein [Deltaproteobacteria bacterium]|nr:teichoic acid biosynthesis protein [Deltaproteobacteria bacterium]